MAFMSSLLRGVVAFALCIKLADAANYACNAYTASACQRAAEAEGLQIGGGGYDFIGSWSTKGCYAYREGEYAGMAFFGTGGSQGDKWSELTGEKYRPFNHDCTSLVLNEGYNQTDDGDCLWVEWWKVRDWNQIGLRLTSGENVTWWKGITNGQWEMMATQDDRHGPQEGWFSRTHVNGAWLSKAKMFGIHTPMWPLQVAGGFKDGYMYSIAWLADSGGCGGVSRSTDDDDDSLVDLDFGDDDGSDGPADTSVIDTLDKLKAWCSEDVAYCRICKGGDQDDGSCRVKDKKIAKCKIFKNNAVCDRIVGCRTVTKVKKNKTKTACKGGQHGLV